MNKEEFLKMYNNVKDNIDDLYMYNCLLLSGFDETDAFKNIGLLKELWLKDETDTSIGTLSDLLFENIDDLDVEEMSIREMLCKIM